MPQKLTSLRIAIFAILLAAIPVLVSVCSAEEDYKLIWSDEFNDPNGAGINASKWNFDNGNGDGGWGNGESQNYTNRTANAYIENGSLIIAALKENYGAQNYTSARIHTYRKFNLTYGKVEMRAKLPFGQGVWPAFWMLGDNIDQVGWPCCGEIDIMEFVGKNPNRIRGSIHGPCSFSQNCSKDKCDYNQYGIGSDYVKESGFSDAYHNYSIEWEPNEIRWYFDDEKLPYQTRNPSNIINETTGQQYPWVFDHDFRIILNLAIGGNWPGEPDNSTIFPQKYYIDYVRVYKHQA